MSRSVTWESPVAEGSDLSALVWRIAENGVLAAIIGAGVVAVWFLVLDLVTRGMPFYTRRCWAALCSPARLRRR